MGVLFCLASTADADQVQFKILVNGRATYASFANVQVLNPRNIEQFRGDTDRYGRIRLDIPPGDYRAVVAVRGTTKTANLKLTGETKLRVVVLN